MGGLYILISYPLITPMTTRILAENNMGWWKAVINYSTDNWNKNHHLLLQEISLTSWRQLLFVFIRQHLPEIIKKAFQADVYPSVYTYVLHTR